MYGGGTCVHAELVAGTVGFGGAGGLQSRPTLIKLTLAQYWFLRPPQGSGQHPPDDKLQGPVAAAAAAREARATALLRRMVKGTFSLPRAGKVPISLTSGVSSNWG